MRISRAFSVLVSNFQNVFKLLAYLFIVFLLTGGCTYAIVQMNLNFITESEEWEYILYVFSQIWECVRTGQFDTLAAYFNQLEVGIGQLGEYLKINLGGMIGSVVGVFLLYVLGRFFVGLGSFNIGEITYKRMSLGVKIPFTTSFFALLGKSVLYTVVYVPLSIVYDLLCVGLSVFIFFGLFSFLNGLLTTMFTVTAIVALISLKLTAISAWMPAMVDGKKLFESAKKSLSAKTNFGGRFASYLVSVYLIMAGNVLAAISTLGSALVITLPCSYILVVCLQFVHYFEDNGKRYFISDNRIVEHGDLVK